jgi:hypothetical protein
MLKGKANELGTYECRWNNSRGEARHKQFTVSLYFIEEKTDNKTDINNIIMCVTATVIGLLLIGMGIGIKFYLDKVINKLILNVDQFRLTFKVLKKKRELEKLLNGDPARIDPDLPMEYQTEFLPYDKKWEFPRKRLRLGLLFFDF